MPGALLITQLTVLLFAGLCVAAALNDIKDFTIPNQICLSIALLYPAFVIASPQAVDWLGGLGVAAIAFVVGFFLFSRGWLGGGDAKLIAASALWAGPTYIAEFILLTTLAGGGLAIVIWLWQRLASTSLANLFLRIPGDPGFAKQRMPYGVAVALGGLVVAQSLLKGA